MKKLVVVVVLAVSLALGACGSSDDAGGGGGTTSNDKVLTGNQYTEVFKDEGDGKNYLYTITEFDNSSGERCTVVTGDSEQTIALSCVKPVK